jgi:hypothetical protein
MNITPLDELRAKELYDIAQPHLTSASQADGILSFLAHKLCEYREFDQKAPSTLGDFRDIVEAEQMEMQVPEDLDEKPFTD